MLMENHDCGHSPNEDYIRCPICVLQELDNAKLQVDAYRKMEADIAKEMGCSMSNWGENSDWCEVHERNPMECQSLEILRMNRLINEIASAWKEQNAAEKANVPSGEFQEDFLRSQRVTVAAHKLEKILDSLSTPEEKQEYAQASKVEDPCVCTLKSHPVRANGTCSNCGGVRADIEKREPPAPKLHPLTCGQCGSVLADLGHGSHACQNCFGVRPLSEKRKDVCDTCKAEIPAGDCCYNVGKIQFCGRCGVPQSR